MTAPINTTYFLILLDSSLTVQEAWPRLIFYLQQTLQRLGQSGTESRLQIASVTYATADTVPSPILAKHPFVDAPLVYNDWKNQNWSKLALGEIAVNKNIHTSTLEGLVAALELFDNIPPAKTPNARAVNRILHISATPSDDTKHPQWNVSTAFDQTSWQTLPAEFQKRNILISGVCLQENTSLFEFYKSVSGDTPQQPWFSVQSGHHVSLYGFPPPSSRPPKRTPDGQNSPDAKRPRTGDPSTATSPPISTSPPKASTPSKEPEGAPLNVVLTTQKAQHLMGQLRMVNAMLQRIEVEIQVSKANGNTERLAKLEQDQQKFKERQALITRPLNQFKAQLVSQHATGTTGPAPAPAMEPSTSADNNTTPASTQPRLRPPPLNLSAQETTPNPTGPSNTNNPPSMPPAPVPQPDILGSQPPNLAAQMQKLIQQQTQARAGGTSVPPVMHHEPSGSNSSLPTPTPPSIPTRTPIWQGAMVFTGPDQPHTPVKEFAVPMSAYCPSSSAEYHPETWPKTIKLGPTFKPLNSPSDLAPWVKRYSPLMCTLLPQEPDSKTFRALFTFLQSKKMYATGGWTLPSGAQKTNVLVFALGEALIGAFFPHAGIPEFSHLDLTAPIVTQNPKPIPPQLMARLSSLPPEQRERFLQLQFQQAQQQQIAAMASSMGAPGNAGGGVSFEIFQSFMQRKGPGV